MDMSITEFLANYLASRSTSDEDCETPDDLDGDVEYRSYMHARGGSAW